MNNIIDEPPEWHQDQWSKGIVRITSVVRPSDRKPWAMAWFATYKNGDVIAFMEWPNFDFASCVKSPIPNVEAYRNIIKQSEDAIGREVDYRYLHPAYAIVKKGISRTIRQTLSGPCRPCLQVVSCKEWEDLTERDEEFQQAERSCSHKLSYVPWPDYPEAERDGRMRTREAMGTEDTRPRFFVIRSAMPNMIYALQNYAWSDENDVTNESAQDQNSEFPSLIAGGYLKRFEKWTEDKPGPKSFGPRQFFRPRLEPRKA